MARAIAEADRRAVTGGELAAERYYARLEGLVSQRLRDRCVLVAGLGAASYLAEKLLRCGVNLCVVDPDVVELENLSRSVYTVADLGASKVDALARRLAVVNPLARVTAFAVDVCQLDDPAVEQLLAGIDLMVAATDHFPAQARVNVWSQTYGIPAVFVGAHADGAGGRVVWSMPSTTPCYRCVAADRYAGYELEGASATGIAGGRAMVPDLQIIDMVALKIALAILERGESTVAGRFFAAMRWRTEVIVRTAPDYEFGVRLLNAALSDLPTAPKPFARQLSELWCAVDTIWLATRRRPGCPDCCGHPPAVSAR